MAQGDLPVSNFSPKNFWPKNFWPKNFWPKNFWPVSRLGDSLWQGLAICGLAGVMLLTNLGAAALLDDDEPNNAECAREMFVHGNWMVPVLNAGLRTDKPVLIYWLMIVGYALFGVSEFAARLPSAVMATGTLLCTYLLGRSLFSARVGLAAAFILVTCPLFVAVGRWATPEATLLFCCTLATTLFVLGSRLPAASHNQKTSSWRLQHNPHTPSQATSGQETPGQETSGQETSGQETSGQATSGQDNELAGLRQADTLGVAAEGAGWFPRHWAWMVGFYAALGLAVLAKGPVGVVLPVGVLGGFLLADLWGARLRTAWQQTKTPRPTQSPTTEPRSRMAQFREMLGTMWPQLHLRDLVSVAARMRLGLGVLVVSAVALPWYIWVGVETQGVWLADFLGKHHFERATEPMERHSGPFFYYLPALLAGTFPWAMVLPLSFFWGCTRLVQGGPVGRATLLLCCWAGVYVLVYSAVQTKLPHYIAPAYPAVALLIAAFLQRWVMAEKSPTASTDPLADARSPRLRWALRIGFLSVPVVGAIIVIAVFIAARLLLPGQEIIAVVGLIPVVGGWLAWRYYEADQRVYAVTALSAVALSLVLTTFAWALPRVTRFQHTVMLAKTIGDRPVAACSYFRSTLAFYLRRPCRRLGVNGVEQFWRKHPDGLVVVLPGTLERLQKVVSPGHRLVTVKSFRRFLRSSEVLLVQQEPHPDAPPQFVQQQAWPGLNPTPQFNTQPTRKPSRSSVLSRGVAEGSEKAEPVWR